MMRAEIAAIEYYLPKTVLTNDELAQLYPGWPASFVKEKTGIEDFFE